MKTFTPEGSFKHPGIHGQKWEGCSNRSNFHLPSNCHNWNSLNFINSQKHLQQKHTKTTTTTITKHHQPTNNNPHFLKFTMNSPVAMSLKQVPRYVGMVLMTCMIGYVLKPSGLAGAEVGRLLREVFWLSWEEKSFQISPVFFPHDDVLEWCLWGSFGCFPPNVSYDDVLDFWSPVAIEWWCLWWCWWWIYPTFLFHVAVHQSLLSSLKSNIY